MKFDPIGMYKGKAISTMNREELLEFATWATQKIDLLTKIESETQDYRLKQEIDSALKN